MEHGVEQHRREVEALINGQIHVTLKFDADKKTAMGRNTPQSRNAPPPQQAVASSSV